MRDFDKDKKLVDMIISKHKGEINLSWSEINELLNLDYSPCHTRKISYGVMLYHDYLNSIENTSVSDEELYEKTLKKEIEIKKMATKISDMRNLVNRMTK